MQAFSAWVLLVLAAAIASHGVNSECNESTPSVRAGTSTHSLVTSGVNFTTAIEPDESANGSGMKTSSSGSDSSSVAFPTGTTTTPSIQSATTEQPAAMIQAPTDLPAAAPSTTPSSPIESNSRSSSQSSEPSVSAADPTQSTAASSETSSFDSTSIAASSTGDPSFSSRSVEDDSAASIAQPGSDSSTFQSVASVECSKQDVNDIYTLYSNCRSAFDLCVAASDYQIFPFQGKHPTQSHVQAMAESDACVAVFIVVIEANFSACKIGGMPLVSAVETLLKISVDLTQGLDDKAPTTEEFQQLVTWRYQVDLAKAAGVPYDGNSELYAEFETNLDAALETTTIRVNKDLSVDVRLSNGSYETFEDAIDLIVTDASAADLTPGYVVASGSSTSGSSTSSRGIVTESSVAVAGCTPTLWSLVVAVVASTLVLGERII